MSLNKVTLIGELGTEVTTKNLSNSMYVSNFSLVTTESWKDESGAKKESKTWHRVVCWGSMAQLAASDLKKGDKVFIEGRITNRTWENKSKEKKYISEITTEKIIFLNSNNDKKTNQLSTKNMVSQSQISEAIALADAEL